MATIRFVGGDSITLRDITVEQFRPIFERAVMENRTIAFTGEPNILINPANITVVVE